MDSVNEHPEDIALTYQPEIVERGGRVFTDAPLRPFGTHDPRASRHAGFGMGMAFFLGARPVFPEARFRIANRYDLGLHGRQAFPVGLRQDDPAPREGFLSGDRSHEGESTHRFHTEKDIS